MEDENLEKLIEIISQMTEEEKYDLFTSFKEKEKNKKKKKDKKILKIKLVRKN